MCSFQILYDLNFVPSLNLHCIAQILFAIVIFADTYTLSTAHNLFFEQKDSFPNMNRLVRFHECFKLQMYSNVNSMLCIVSPFYQRTMMLMLLLLLLELFLMINGYFQNDAQIIDLLISNCNLIKFIS
jgi:hypothetical protein